MATGNVIESLTIREIGIMRNRLGGVDPLDVIVNKRPEVYEALATVAWLLTRRADRDADYDRFLDMTPAEVSDVLDELIPDGESVEESAAENPTAPELGHG